MNKPKNLHRNLRSLMREGSADFDPVPARQPAPDVKALMEALTELCDEIDNHDIHSAISKTNILWFKRKAREALSAHRERGGEA